MRTFIEEAFNKGNLAILDEIVDPDYRFLSPDSEINGREELKSFIRDIRRGLPDLKLTIDDQLVDGEKSCTCFTLTGTHREEYLGIPATQRQVEIHGIVVSRYQANRIIEEWEILDQLSLINQLGTDPCH
jgi:steroid delta-isomerase-like uncharacterized protein